MNRKTILCKLALPIGLALLQSQPVMALETSFGGSIKTLAIFDSSATGIGVNIPANALYGRDNNTDFKIDASLSQIKANFLQDFDNGTEISSHFVMDFNANNDGTMSPRLREAYLNWELGSGSLTLGQTWSTFMDMKNYPLSLAEPTLSGVVFKRQPMIRWSQDFSGVKYDIALESSTNSEISNSKELTTSGSLPDLVGGIEFTGEQNWLRLTSALGQVRVQDDSNNYQELKYGVQLSLGHNFINGDQVTLLTNTGKGMERYLLGISGTGATWNENTSSLDLRETNSLMLSYTRQWNSSLKSVAAYGHAKSSPLNWQEQQNVDTFTSSDYAMINFLWQVQKALTVGVEYDYSKYVRTQDGSRVNHRVMMGVEWKY